MQEQTGTIRHLGGVDLTGKEGFLAKLSHDSGTAEAVLPTAQADHCIYIVKHGDADGKLIDLDPLTPGAVQTAKLKGTCNPGDDLVLADQTTAADAGKLRVLPVAAGTYMLHAKAEEAGVDGQIVRIRAVGVRAITVGA
ncbi:MAG: hypothetical protein EA353_03795 [Puniceicoccaceae bacterium]|nr:MAG: hypothetical protein EA353_03795 [Puniceicoccaceae bacterium]